jgi:uncharacterized iron-regulated protein
MPGMRLARGLIVVLFLAVVFPSWLAAGAADPIYKLSLGDPARRTKDAPVVLDAIIDTATGETIDATAMASRLRSVRLLLVGETHTSVESHRVELQVLRALHAAGRKIVIGLEMFPYDAQPALDAWNQGRWTEQQFLDQSHWYEAWGYHWGYYRDIFLFARQAHLPLVAVNAPRAVVSTVRQKGLAAVSSDDAAHLPPRIDVESDEHLAFFKASFAQEESLHSGMSDEALKSMLAAQATWDGAMGWNATKALANTNDPSAIAVVLAGSGHVAYGLGIERQARTWFDGAIASIIPVPIADDHGPIPNVRASYANFIWGVAREQTPRWPELGISTMAGEGGRRRVIDVEKDTAAARAGIAVDDVILAIDGTDIVNREALNRVMAGREWGDVLTVRVTRKGQELTLPVALRRVP